MNFSCIFFLALALFGAIGQAYIASNGIGYRAAGTLGYNSVCNTVCGSTCGASYGSGYEGGYGCRTACAPACRSAAVCDSCQCLKTIVRPNIIERIPYSCSRRVQSTSCRPACEMYSENIYGGAGIGAVGAVGAVGGACSGYLNGGYLY